MVAKTLVLLIVISSVVTACESSDLDAAILPNPTSISLATATAIPLPTVVKPAIIPTIDLTANRGGMLSIAARTVVDDLDIHREFSPTLAAFGPGIVYLSLIHI